MKKEWTTKPLAELCEFQRGLTYAKGDEVESSNNGVLRANNIDLATNSLDLSELRYISNTFAVPANKLVRPDSLLICTASGSKSHLGKVAFIDDNYGYAFGGFMGQLTPGQALVPRFLFHLMTSEAYKEFIAALSDGANINNLKFDDLGKFAVPVPPLAEQQRIVGVLDEAFAGLATAEAHAAQNLQNARALFESHLQSVFTHRGKGWAEHPLSTLCHHGKVITYGVVQLGAEVPNGVPCLRTSNVRWLRIDTEGMKRIAPKLSARYSRTILEGGEVLVNVRGTLGGVGVASPEMRGWNVSREVAVAPVDPMKVNPRFAAYCIGSGVSQEWLGGMKKGTAYVGINIEDLRNLPVHAPSINHQGQIVEHLDALAAETQRLTRIYEQKQAALAALKKSLLHQAFSGEL